MNPRGEKNRIA